MYQQRFYRKEFSKGWHTYEVSIKETDIFVESIDPLDKTKIYQSVEKYRKELEDYIEVNPEFQHRLSSFSLKSPSSSMIKEMVEKTSLLDVGPMASVAGAIAEYVGKGLSYFSSQLIVENGGDIFIKKRGSVLLGMYAGENSFINDYAISLENNSSYLGVCSSSSFLGHSLSLGNLDLACVVSNSVIFADALATKLANMVNDDEDIEKALEFSKKFDYTQAVLLVRKEKVGIWGQIKLVKK